MRGLFLGFGLLLAAGATGLALQVARTAPPFEIPGVPLAHDVEATRARARAQPCSTAMPSWLAVLDEVPEDREALQAIAACARSGGQLGLADDAARVVSLAARLRVLDPSQALSTLGRALALSPGDHEVQVAYAYSLVDAGEVEPARAALRHVLETTRPRPTLAFAYQVCLAWPVPTGAIAVGVLGLVAALGAQRPPDWARALREAVPELPLPLVAAAVPAIGAGLWTRFALTGDRRSFVTALLLVAVGIAWTALSPLRVPLGRVASRAVEQVLSVLAGRSRALRPGWVGAMLFGALVVLLVVAPALPVAAGLVVMAASVLVATSALGVLLLAVAERAGSLRASLRWMAGASTLPYLLYFLYVERAPLLAPISAGRWLDPDASQRIGGYVVVWAMGLVLALWLARILGRSILAPIERLEDTVRRIEQGDLAARSGVRRGDELGLLSRALDAMAVGLAERRRIEATFRRYVDPRVADRLLAGDLERGRTLHATVLFSDIRGFTTSSEQSDPERVVELLNDYFGRMAPVVARHGGVVDKFLGDGMLAVWGVPEPCEDGERRAVAAAREMLGELEGFNADLATRGLPPVRVGIGVHAGPVVAGPVGSPDRREYTVIGDTVNTAQRVESQARGPHAILVTAEVRAHVDGTWEELPPVAVKGKAEPLALYGAG